MHSASALDEMGDRAAPIGSRPWAAYYVRLARERRKDLQADVAHLRETVETLERGAAWKAFGLLSLEILCAKQVGLERADLDAIRVAKPGTSLGAALRSGPGRPKKGEENPGNAQISPSAGGGRTVAYALARLDRDHQELAAKVRAGELSAHAAAIQAGFRRRTISVPLDPDAIVRLLRKHLDARQLAAVRDAL